MLTVPRKVPTLLLAALAVSSPALLGCGNQGPFEYVKVSGRVTYEDGSTIPGETIRVAFKALDFENDDPNVTPRPGKTTLNTADGTFENVTSYKYGDGLVPGRHRVAIVALNKQGQVSKAIPREYTTTADSPLIINTDDAPFEIKVPKP